MGAAATTTAAPPPVWSWPALWQLALYHALFVYAVFCFPSMLTAAHTLLLVPFVLLYMAVAYPLSALLKALGIVKGRGMPPLGKDSWQGKVCMVTGANTGIGKEAARSLARYGATVVLGVRNAARGEAAKADIIASLVEEGGHGSEAEVEKRVVVLLGDLQDLDDVARCARAFCDRFPRLDALVLNAGLAGFHSRRTAQGFNLILGVNFLGHFALARALLPLLEATARRFYGPGELVQPRVVCVSSTLHQWSRPDPAFLLEEHERRERGEKVVKPWYGYLLESVHKRDPYPDSKLAQLLLAFEINRLAKAAGSAARVRAIAVNPGAVATDIWRFFPDEAREKYIAPTLRALFLTPHQGAVPVVAAAVAEPYDDAKDPDELYMTPYFVPFEGRLGGLVLFDLFSPSYGYQRAVPRLPEHSEAKARKLWALGERISRPHLQAQGFLKEAWPPVVEGEDEPATPTRLSVGGGGGAVVVAGRSGGSPSKIGEEPREALAALKEPAQ